MKNDLPPEDRIKLSEAADVIAQRLAPFLVPLQMALPPGYEVAAFIYDPADPKSMVVALGKGDLCEAMRRINKLPYSGAGNSSRRSNSE